MENSAHKTAAGARLLRGLLIEMRPKEWTKSLLVFTGLIFSKSLLNVESIALVSLGFITFCLASSGVYIFNDLNDVDADRNHPIKSRRPIAAGIVGIAAARTLMIALFALSVVSAFFIHHLFAAIIGVYLLICAAYSLKLKDVVILDVILIAAGFVLRAVSGAVIIGVEVSEWLVLCTSMVALLVGFGKRRYELVLLDVTAEDHRKNLSDYSISFLDSIMNICAGAAVITYALYTRADQTVERVGSKAMLLTIPFVVYGVFRYLYLAQKKKIGGDPVSLLFSDIPTIINLLFWILSAAAIIYLPFLHR